MNNGGSLIIPGCVAFLIVVSLVFVVVRASRRTQRLQRSRDRSTLADDTALSDQQQGASLASSFAPSVHQRALVSSISPGPLSYERFPHLNASLQQAKARRELVTALSAPLTMLLHGCITRALDLSREQSEISQADGARAVADLLNGAAGDHPSVHLSFPNGADPLVTLLLLHADCRDDALRYFCLSSGASLAEARDAIDTLQPLVDGASWFFFEEGMPGEPPLDPASLHFLIQAGYTTLAIRYYRRRTAVGFVEAKKAVEEIAHRLA